MSLLNQSIDKTLEFAKKLKISDLDIIAQVSDSLSLKAEKGDLSEYKKSNSQVLGVRVIKDSRVGISYTEALDDESIKITLENALLNSKYSKLDPFQEINTQKINLLDINPENNCDHRPSVEQMIEKTLYLEDQIYKREKLATNAPYNGVGQTNSKLIMANSKNVYCEYHAQTFNCYTSALLSENGKNSMHYFGHYDRDFRKLKFDQCIDESINVAKNLLHAGQIKSGNYKVAFDIEIFEDLFHSFSIMLSAKAVIDKTNPWANKMGSIISDTRLTIMDDPFFQAGFSRIPFDSEGFKKQKNIFVQNGELKDFLHNSATAKELSMKNNFCASRGPRAPLGASFSNLVIDKGSDAKASLSDQEYVEITNAQGLHSGVNAISGDFSIGVSGRVIKNNEVQKYFKDVTVSGNFYNMLNRIFFLGDEIHHSPGRTFFAPKIIFDDLFMAGN